MPVMLMMTLDLIMLAKCAPLPLVIVLGPLFWDTAFLMMNATVLVPCIRIYHALNATQIHNGQFLQHFAIFLGSACQVMVLTLIIMCNFALHFL